MSKAELSRLEVMERLIAKRMKQSVAAKHLGVSGRQVKRLLQAYREQGAAGLVSKRRGQPSNNQLSAAVKQEVLRLVKKRYADFGRTLAHEKLTEVHELKISVESVRLLMTRDGLWTPRGAQAARVPQMRERRACLGELVQIDG